MGTSGGFSAPTRTVTIAPSMSTDKTSVPNLLTLVITTSVTPSIPSTDLLSTVLDSYRSHCEGLLECRVIVVFDNYDQIGPVARLKKGLVTPEQARDWDAYKCNAKEYILSQFSDETQDLRLVTDVAHAEYGLPKATNSVALSISRTQNSRVTFLEPARRLGFGLAVRSALRVVETPYVWIQQHDWSLSAYIPLQPILHVMQATAHDTEVPVKYVCFSAVRMFSYATSNDVVRFPTLKELTSRLKRKFSVPGAPNLEVPLTPMFFWHDKPHIAATEHYLARVFPSRLAMLRGDFIEDKIGQRAREQMKQGMWSKWATWLYYPEEGKQLCLRHLQGRVWRGTDAQSKLIAMYRENNARDLEKTKTTCSRAVVTADVTDAHLPRGYTNTAMLTRISSRGD